MSKLALITGCSRGIGKAIAVYFLDKGWDVFGVDIAPCDLPLTLFYQEDVSKIQTFEKISSELSVKKKTLSCLINNAAIQIAKSIVETTQEDWKTLIGTNVDSVFYSIKLLYPFLSGGSIVNMASVHARATSPKMTAYATSKGALCALTRAAAVELSEFGIRVNAVLPGAVDTEMLRYSLERNQSGAEALDKLVSSTPLGRLGKDLDIAKLVYFLAEEELSSNITGQEFVCDGGVLARLASE